jgi:hypothetical protein
MATSSLTPQLVRALLLDYLKRQNRGQLEEAVNGVLQLAMAKGLVPSGVGAVGVTRLHFQTNVNVVRDHVQQLMWQLLAQGLLVWGMDAGPNDKYPFYRMTEYGREVVQQDRPQPYDPDGFLGEFDRLVVPGDEVARAYLAEAVRAFNANCFKSAAVMVGGASEQLIVVLIDTFRDAITDPAEMSRFDKDAGPATAVSRRYRAAQERLDRMVVAKKLSFELAETVGNELPSAFHFIRRCRNDAGHPTIPTHTDPDTVFLNLRVFVEYARRVTGLSEFFKTNPATW